MPNLEKMVDDYYSFRKDKEIIDCNMWWAPLDTKNFVHFDTFSDMVSEIKKYGITSGIITDRKTINFDWNEGNERVKENIKNLDGFYGAMTVAPDILFKEGGEEYINSLIKSKFVCARMFPKGFEHSMKEYVIGDLLKILEKNNIPLMVWHDQVSFDEMDEILKNHPKLNLIVEGHDVKYLYYVRNYMSLLKKYDNFYMESHNLVLGDEFEIIWKLTGRMNVLYGSYYPYGNPNFGLYRIFSADIPDSAKELILNGNAKKLFFGKEASK